MKRALLMASACLFLFGLTGCSSDPRDEQIKRVVAALEEAVGDVQNVSDGIEEAVKKAKADPEKKELTEAELKPAIEAIDRLKKVGDKLQIIKAKIDSLPDPPAEDQKKELIDKNKADLEGKLERLDKEQRRLEVVLRDSAPYIQRDAMSALRTKLKEAEEKYLTLGQRQ
jgi:DNA-binding transcriptional MerR regulator